MTTFHKDCCEACKIGLVIGSSFQQCSLQGYSFGSPWDDITEDCCTDILEETNPDNGDSETSNAEKQNFE
jgi:fibulin 1/2